MTDRTIESNLALLKKMGILTREGGAVMRADELFLYWITKKQLHDTLKIRQF